VTQAASDRSFTPVVLSSLPPLLLAEFKKESLSYGTVTSPLLCLLKDYVYGLAGDLSQLASITLSAFTSFLSLFSFPTPSSIRKVSEATEVHVPCSVFVSGCCHCRRCYDDSVA
jgi:hypothetical protein